jgi:cyclopropane fatty-acyl-phospholipid synthase-like methyltransferase
MLSRYKKYDPSFVKSNLMGPNVIKIAEEFSEHIQLKEGMKVLDLGCGKGLSSIFLAKEFGVTVFATDLWISATENYERIKEMNLESKIFPIHSDAHSLPYADNFFDAIVSFDAYHYFGTNERYLCDYIIKLLKPGGLIGFASPGLTEEFIDGIPDNLQKYCADFAEFITFHSHLWWRKLWKSSRLVDVLETFDLNCNADAWKDWITSDNPIGKNDTNFFNDVKQLTTIGVIGKKIGNLNML